LAISAYKALGDGSSFLLSNGTTKVMIQVFRKVLQSCTDIYITVFYTSGKKTRQTNQEEVFRDIKLLLCAVPPSTDAHLIGQKD
jgi:hypothetical protein